MPKTKRLSKSSLAVFAFLINLCLSVGAQDLPLTNPHKDTAKRKAPLSGPYHHVIRSASSTDGLHWKMDVVGDIVLHASVPTAMAFSNGTIRVYFVDFALGYEQFSCIEAKDGVHYVWGNCELKGITSYKAVDFCLVSLKDGRYRLYYYASDKEVMASGVHRIDSAFSKDGVAFVREATVFEYKGLVDPDVFWNGSEWIMHVFSLAHHRTVVATSQDGESFQYKGILSPKGYGVTKPVQLANGKFRMYGFNQNGQTHFVSFISSDGYNWKMEKGIRLKAPENYEITDPFVIRLSNETYKMYYKLDKSPVSPGRKRPSPKWKRQ